MQDEGQKALNKGQCIEYEIDQYIKVSIPKTATDDELRSMARKISVINSESEEHIYSSLKLKLKH